MASITQGAASLCPGLGAGCPFRACTSAFAHFPSPLLPPRSPSSPSFLLLHAPPSSSFILFCPLPSSPILPKKCGLENKYLLTFSLAKSPKKPSTLRRKNPQTPRKKFLSNVKKFISEVKMPFFGQKKRRKTRLFRALSSLLVQIYNIFRRNPNCFNISQHASKAHLQRFAADGGWRVVYYEGGATSFLGILIALILSLLG